MGRKNKVGEGMRGSRESKMCKSRGGKARAWFDSYENGNEETKEKLTGGKSNNRATVTARNR